MSNNTKFSDVMLYQIHIDAPGEPPFEPVHAVGCVLVAAVSEEEYKALLKLKRQCEEGGGWLRGSYQAENGMEQAILGIVDRQLIVSKFLRDLVWSRNPALKRFADMLNPPADNLYIGTGTIGATRKITEDELRNIRPVPMPMIDANGQKHIPSSLEW